MTTPLLRLPVLKFFIVLILVPWLALVATAQEPAATRELSVTFQLNDAFVKDKPLASVRVSIATAPGEEIFISGNTDDQGRFDTTLAADTYAVSYALAGYVPIGDSETLIHSDGQIVTTTLSMMLEAEGGEIAHRVRIILNWGSDPEQVRDADSHLICPCELPDHVYYASKSHIADNHSAELDVDDTDWGGPETITIRDPVPGRYHYWVHDYSGPPALLGSSDVVVRVLFDDTVAAELKLPADLSARVWRPFAAIEVGADLQPRIVSLTPEQLAAGADRQPPPGYETPEAPEPDSIGIGAVLVSALILAIVAGMVLKRLLGR